MIQDIITIALVCNEEVMLIHAYISALKGEVLRGDDKSHFTIDIFKEFDRP